MNICRYGPAGQEKPGLLDRESRLRDLSGVVADIGPAQLSRSALVGLASVNPDTLPLVDGVPRLGVPFTGVSKYICIGLNYVDHAREGGLPPPDEPIVFLKAPSALCGPNDDTVQPLGSTKLDWEVELAVIIGDRASYVAEADALSFVAGYCLANDISERAFQMQSSQWDKGKGFDTFGPLGPWLVTTDEVRDPQALALWLEVNGTRMQDGTTADMIFGVAKLVSYVSHCMTLMPGDVIATGTPAGVGLGKKPTPIYLKAGDVVRLGIDGLGEQSQRILPYPDTSLIADRQ